MSIETHRIKVTNKDIFTSQQGEAEACMVWKAVIRELQIDPEGPITVSVDGDTVAISNDGEIEVELPMDVRDRIVDWDDQKSSVKPFEFDLNLPSDWREQVAGAGAAAVDDVWYPELG